MMNIIHPIPQPMPDWTGYCDWCPFLDETKAQYCNFLKKDLMYYDGLLSECDLDYDCEWVLNENKKNEKNTCCTMGTI